MKKETLSELLYELLDELATNLMSDRYNDEMTQDDYMCDAELQAIDTLKDYLENL